ncbi:MAG: hypothetical protein EAZ76_06550 [Nostocales cyanobacterium]|nr:MAG: hypothetical protein EAZ76_06550 [Nostocales cyanobacterium]
MNRLLKSLVTISALSSLVITPAFLSVGKAAAETQKGTDASYIGAGVAAGVTNGGKSGDAATFGGNITGRLKVGNTPFSARGNVLWSDETSAIIPEISVDVPIANKTNVFVTGGYSFVESDGKPTPLGNRDSVVVGAGVESEVTKNFLVYTNAKVGLGAYQNSDASAVSINGGIGYRFK